MCGPFIDGEACSTNVVSGIRGFGVRGVWVLGLRWHVCCVRAIQTQGTFLLVQYRIMAKNSLFWLKNTLKSRFSPKIDFKTRNECSNRDLRPKLNNRHIFKIQKKLILGLRGAVWNVSGLSSHRELASGVSISNSCLYKSVCLYMVILVRITRFEYLFHVLKSL